MKIRIFKKDLNSFSKYNISKDDDDYHYLINVLKVSAEDCISVFSNDIEIEFSIEIITKKFIILNPIKNISNNENLEFINKLAFILPIIKMDKLNLIAKQIVEIGFGHIFLAKTNFSKELEKNYKETKFFANIKEALEQSDGFYFPQIHQVQKLDKIINNLNDFTILYGDFSENAIQSKDLFFQTKEINIINDLKNDLKNKKKIAVLIGPEGGFSSQELELLNHTKCFGISLGERKQRCETASVYLMGIAKNILMNII